MALDLSLDGEPTDPPRPIGSDQMTILDLDIHDYRIVMRCMFDKATYADLRRWVDGMDLQSHDGDALDPFWKDEITGYLIKQGVARVKDAALPPFPHARSS